MSKCARFLASDNFRVGFLFMPLEFSESQHSNKKDKRDEETKEPFIKKIKDLQRRQKEMSKQLSLLIQSDGGLKESLKLKQYTKDLESAAYKNLSNDPSQKFPTKLPDHLKKLEDEKKERSLDALAGFAQVLYQSISSIENKAQHLDHKQLLIKDLITTYPEIQIPFDKTCALKTKEKEFLVKFLEEDGEIKERIIHIILWTTEVLLFIRKAPKDQLSEEETSLYEEKIKEFLNHFPNPSYQEGS